MLLYNSIYGSSRSFCAWLWSLAKMRALEKKHFWMVSSVTSSQQKVSTFMAFKTCTFEILYINYFDNSLNHSRAIWFCLLRSNSTLTVYRCRIGWQKHRSIAFKLHIRVSKTVINKTFRFRRSNFLSCSQTHSSNKSLSIQLFLVPLVAKKTFKAIGFFAICNTNIGNF